MSKVLVTGANGYIGSHVVQILAEMGYDVIAADVKPMNITNPNVQYCSQNIFSDEPNLYEKLGSPEILIHLAWQDGFVHHSEKHLTTLPMHYQFIRKMIESGLKSVSVMGSMHEVGYYEGALDETVPNNPRSLYGISKNALRSSLEILNQKVSFVFHWLRGFYICGDDRRNNSIFAKLLQASDDEKTEFPFTTGESQFDFIDIEDLALEIVLASIQEEVTGIINCCSGKPMKLKDKIEQFIKDRHLNINLKYGAFPEREYDSKIIYGNTDKIKIIVNNAINSHIVSDRVYHLKELLES